MWRIRFAMTTDRILPQNTTKRANSITAFVLEILWNLLWAGHFFSPDNKDSQIMDQIYLQGCIIIVNIFLHAFQCILWDKCLFQSSTRFKMGMSYELLIGISVSEIGAKAVSRHEFEPNFDINMILSSFSFFFLRPFRKVPPSFWAEQDPGCKWIWRYLGLHF